MFKITENSFIKDKTVKYADDEGNTLRMSAFKDGLRAKLRFSDNTTKANLIEVTDLDTCEGITFKITFLNEKEKEAKQHILLDARDIIETWINMLKDLKSLSTPVEILKKAYPDRSLEEINEYRISFLTEYEELKDVLKSIELQAAACEQ